MPTLEICVDSLASAQAADAGGAQRVELCSGLAEGGLTPSLGLIRAVRAETRLQIFVMIRPRPEDFTYSANDIAIMREDIRTAAGAGAHGVVLGLLTADRKIDVQHTAELVRLARPMGVTFHRAFDLVDDQMQALEDVIRTGADRILTSGGKATALKGVRQLQRLVNAAAGRIATMAGGGVREDNALQILQGSGVTELHSALRMPGRTGSTHSARKQQLGDDALFEGHYEPLTEEDVQRLRLAIGIRA